MTQTVSSRFVSLSLRTFQLSFADVPFGHLTNTEHSVEDIKYEW